MSYSYTVWLVKMSEGVKIHPTAEVSERAAIGKGTKIWHHVHIMAGAEIGEECILGKNVYIGPKVKIGNKVKIQNNVSVYQGSEISDGVFIGPHVILTNDRNPRAVTNAGALKKEQDWNVGKILIKYGASVGAGSIILPDVTIGKFAMVGAGSVVTKNVPDYGLVFGNPAKLHGYVCICGKRIHQINKGIYECSQCKEKIRI